MGETLPSSCSCRIVQCKHIHIVPKPFPTLVNQRNYLGRALAQAASNLIHHGVLHGTGCVLCPMHDACITTCERQLYGGELRQYTLSALSQPANVEYFTTKI